MTRGQRLASPSRGRTGNVTFTVDLKDSSGRIVGIYSTVLGKLTVE